MSWTQLPVYPREANILPPTPGATCPNKTNKSGGPKDVADARPAPHPPSHKDAILEWLERMNGDNECPDWDKRHNGRVPPNIEPGAHSQSDYQSK